MRRVRFVAVAVGCLIICPLTVASADPAPAPLPVIWNSAGIPGLTAADLNKALLAKVPTPFTAVLPTTALPSSPVSLADSEYAYIATTEPSALASMPAGLAAAYKAIPAKTATQVFLGLAVPSVSGPGLVNTNSNDNENCSDPNECQYYTISIQPNGFGARCVSGITVFGLCLGALEDALVEFDTDQSYDLFRDDGTATDQIAATTSHYFASSGDNWTKSMMPSTVQGDPSVFDSTGRGGYAPAEWDISKFPPILTPHPTVTITSDFCIQDEVIPNSGAAPIINVSGIQFDAQFIIATYIGSDHTFSGSSCSVE